MDIANRHISYTSKLCLLFLFWLVSRHVSTAAGGELRVVTGSSDNERSVSFDLAFTKELERHRKAQMDDTEEDAIACS
jgi:hypothetical protein